MLSSNQSIAADLQAVSGGGKRGPKGSASADGAFAAELQGEVQRSRDGAAAHAREARSAAARAHEARRDEQRVRSEPDDRREVAGEDGRTLPESTRTETSAARERAADGEAASQADDEARGAGPESGGEQEHVAAPVGSGAEAAAPGGAAVGSAPSGAAAPGETPVPPGGGGGARQAVADGTVAAVPGEGSGDAGDDAASAGQPAADRARGTAPATGTRAGDAPRPQADASVASGVVSAGQANGAAPAQEEGSAVADEVRGAQVAPGGTIPATSGARAAAEGGRVEQPVTGAAAAAAGTDTAATESGDQDMGGDDTLGRQVRQALFGRAADGAAGTAAERALGNQSFAAALKEGTDSGERLSSLLMNGGRSALETVRTPEGEILPARGDGQMAPTAPTSQTGGDTLLRSLNEALLRSTAQPAAAGSGAPGAAPAQAQSAGGTPQPTLNLAHPLQQPGWDKAMSERVVWMARQELKQAQIQLNPRNMGPIEVKVTVQNDQANVQFVAHNATTRDSLEAAIPRLREMMAEQGLNLAQSEVSQQSFRQQQGSAGGTGGHGPGGGAGAGGPGDGEEEVLVSRVDERGLAGGVDFFA